MKGHDYKAPWKYHLTILKNPDAPSFGRLADGWREAALEHRRNDVKIDYSPAGKAVRDALFEWKRFAPKINLLQYCIMPDHIHLLIDVREYLDEHLGKYVARLKTFAGHRFQYRRSLLGNPSESQAQGNLFLPLFSDGFNDQILWTSRNLDTIFKYIRHNPYKLAIRKAHPGFFSSRHDLTLNLPSGPNQTLEPVRLQAYGNLQLLGNPFKEQVVVHRADTTGQRERNRQRWLYTAANGGILVSPFISAAEKAIRAEAEELGGRFILITNDPMPERYKPTGRDFDLCESGRLLILSINLPGDLNRQTCLAMNALASAIAK